MVEYGPFKIYRPYESFDETEGVLIIKPDGLVNADFVLPPDADQEDIDAINWVAAIIPWNDRLKFDLIHYHESLVGKKTIKIRFPAAFVGGGLAWVEPYSVSAGGSPTNKLPNGFFVKSYGNPGIAKIEWREHSEDNNGNIIEEGVEKYYGEYVQLHIYTQALYGQYIRVKLKDYKRKNKELTLDENVGDDDNPLKDFYTRQVKLYQSVDDPKIKVQKVVINVYLEHRWMRTASSFGSLYKLDIAPIIASDARGFKTYTADKYLKIKKRSSDDILPSSTSKAGNKPTIIGNLMTDVAHFKQCRYEKITTSYAPNENSPVTIFSVSDRINVNVKTHDIGVIATNNNQEQLHITIAQPNFDCYLNTPHTKDILIDSNDLEKSFSDVVLSEDNTKLSFTPKYPYKYIGPKDHFNFLTHYFPKLAAKADKYTIPVETCAFNHKIELAVYPDAAFSYHVQVGKPEDYTGRKRIYYRQVDVSTDMVRGLDKELKKMKKLTNEFEEYLPIGILPLGGPLNVISKELIFAYLKTEAKDYAFGFHGYHTFTSPTEATLVDYGKEYPWLPRTCIAIYLVVGILVDAVILYLTRGRSAAAKATSLGAKMMQNFKTAMKWRKYYKTAKKVASGTLISPAADNYSKTSFIMPQLSGHRGTGYVIREDGRVGVEIKERVDAAPLFGLMHTMKGTLADIVMDLVGISKVFDLAEQVVGVVGHLRTIKSATDDAKKVIVPESGEDTDDEKKGISRFFRFRDIQKSLDAVEGYIRDAINEFIKDKTGSVAEIEFSLVGFYSAFYELSIDFLDNSLQLDIFEGEKTYQQSSNTNVTFGRDYGINAVLKIVGTNKSTQKWSKLNHYTPDFLPVEFKDTKLDLEVEGELNGSLVFERSYGWEQYTTEPKPVMTDTLIFTGIVGSTYVKMKFEIEPDEQDEEVEDENYDPLINVELGSKDPNGNKKQVVLELIPAFTIPIVENQPVFDTKTWTDILKRKNKTVARTCLN